jgi:hypothetical protein
MMVSTAQPIAAASSRTRLRLARLSTVLVLLFTGCAVTLVGPYDAITDQSVTDLSTRTELFLERMEATGGGYSANRDFYRDAKANIHTIRLRAELYPKNEGELKLLDQLSENLDNLAQLHRAGPLTGVAGQTARDLIDGNFRSLLEVELAKKRSSGVAAP